MIIEFRRIQIAIYFGLKMESARKVESTQSNHRVVYAQLKQIRCHSQRHTGNATHFIVQ